MTHRVGGLGENFSPWMILLFLQVTGPLFPGLSDETGFCRVGFLWRIISDFCRIFCKSRRYQFVFSPANKMYFICSKENHFICNRKHFIPSGEPQSIILCSDWWKQFQTMLRISVIGCCREEYSEPDARSADGQPPVLRRHIWTTADHQPEGRRDTIEEV